MAEAQIDTQTDRVGPRTEEVRKRDPGSGPRAEGFAVRCPRCKEVVAGAFLRDEGTRLLRWVGEG